MHRHNFVRFLAQFVHTLDEKEKMKTQKSLTRTSTLILSAATMCLVMTAQIAPATVDASVTFSVPHDFDAGVLSDHE